MRAILIWRRTLSFQHRVFARIGGGLVSTGSEFSADVLVGIVSWGFGCADSNFPGVYSRMSAYYDDFLRPAICQYSRSPPSYLNCDPGSTASTPIPTPSPVRTPDGLLTIFVETDPFTPEDLGWELASVSGQVIASRPITYYANRYGQSISEEVIVDPENFYRFTIFDRDRDGFRGEVAVVRGRRNVKSSALVYEPGFSRVSGASVVHGFYVGDNPPRVLTLELTFDRNPEELAWSLINVEDDLPLGFKWFEWYGKDFIKATEQVPIYGNERGRQMYQFTVLDLNGNGMCCQQGQGSFSLYLGDSSSGTLIASGGQFGQDQTFEFEIDSAGLVTNEIPPPTPSPSRIPPSPPSPGYYMAPGTGICQANGASRPAWVVQVFADYDECCEFSWNFNQCIAAKPLESGFWESGSQPTPPSYEPIASYPTSISSPTYINGNGNGNVNSNTVTFAPVTGSYTCKSAGMSCKIKCTACGSIKRVASGMAQTTEDSPKESTIVYTAERGTDAYPDNPSRLILVESDTSTASVISCDEGCTCKSVNDNVLGCGLVATPTGVEVIQVAPSPARPPASINSSTQMVPYLHLASGMVLLWSMLR